MASIVFHSLAIVLIAVGPTLIPGLNGQGDRKSNTVEFSVSEQAQVASAVEAQIPAIPATPVIPEPAQVTEIIKPVEKVVAKKVAPVAKVEKKIVPVKLPEKTVVEEQPAIPAANTESPLEPVASETQEESPVVAQAEEVKTEEVKAEEIKEDAQMEEAQNQALAKAQEEEMKAQQEAQAQAQAAMEKAAADEAAGTGNDATKGSSNVGGGPTEVIEVTQNYLGLKQQSGNQPPRYTREMRLQQLQGRGQLVYFVTKEGKVTDVKLTQSTGSKSLDQAAVNAFSNYKFVPGQEGYTQHDFEFSLKGPAESAGSRLRTTYNRE
jgi:TonB family protein